ncbi:Asp23/Gls24 family envelope stress response protein [Streptomyces paludis]|uniref:Asp23/Gls24 family envelope stress response protein n=1 Tax=Streptomyces paludis TaxID=2282738 RepID=A0A345HZD6_9ACTN|nr:Asp23/Gls24 family envelope stress response protein [Streptomyces paludis]AXG82060.1 Asp23/Gls24 family envelope stress response protein [Streptomyces paludis]
MSAQRKIQDELSLAAADAARGVPGVAFLRPGIVDRLRASAASRAGRAGAGTDGATGGGTAGVRVRPPAGGEGVWQIDIQLVTRAAHRTLDVTRAVRETAGAAAGAVLPGPGDRVRITVTVTGIV